MSVTRVILPKLGLTMDEGRIVVWRKREGERVRKGDVLYEVETDKATMEVESPVDGFVRRVLVPEGEMVPVTTVVALLADDAEEALPEIAARPSPVTSDGERVRSSPAARKRAQELGVDIESIRGTGPGGRITLEDVDAAASTESVATSAGARAPVVGEKREPLTRMRKAVAAAMTRSAREVPQFSISRDVDMGAADRKRRDAGVSYTDVIVAACASALRAHPRMRARFDGDAIVVSEGAHVGIAVALDDGLIVPVLRDAHRKDLATLRREREALEASARSGRLPADAMGPASLTVSNLGTFGVDGFTALVNPPEAAILAVGRVADRVVARDGAPAVRLMVTITLSVDHRVADGADASRFLADVVRGLESPA